MGVRVTPEEYVEKHTRRTVAALDDMRKGIEKVAESPTAKAASDQAQRKMKARWIAAMDSGKIKRRLASVSLDDWKTAAVEKGIPRVSAGIERSTDKRLEFAKQLLEHQSKVLPEIEKMPDLTLEDSINRMATWVRRMAEFEFKR